MEVCQGVDHLGKSFQDILDAGGEGIILRDPSSPFERGRSPGFLKHKVSLLYDNLVSHYLPKQKFRDAEARVVRILGQHQFECELCVLIQCNAIFTLIPYSVQAKRRYF